MTASELRRLAGRLPDPADVDHAKIRKAVEALRKLVEESVAALRVEAEAQTEVSAAEDRDRVKYAAAIRDDAKADPGTGEADRARKALDKARRRRGAVELAASQAHGELVDAVARDRDGWLDTLAGRREEQERWVAATVDELEKAADAMAKTGRLVAFVSAFPDGKFAGVPAIRLEGLTAANGEPYTLGAALAALRARLTPDVDEAAEREEAVA